MSIAQDDWGHGGDVRSCHESCDTRIPGMHPGWLPAQSEVQFIDVHLPLSHVDMLYVTFAYTLLISPTTKGVMSIRRVHQILST